MHSDSAFCLIGLSHRLSTSSRIVAAAQGFPLCGCRDTTALHLGSAAVIRQPYNRSTTALQNLKLLSPCIGDEFYPRIICSSIEVEDNGLAVFIEDKTLWRKFIHVSSIAILRGDGTCLFAIKGILEIHCDIFELDNGFFVFLLRNKLFD